MQGFTIGQKIQTNDKSVRFSQRLKITLRCCIWVAYDCASDPKTRLATQISYGKKVVFKTHCCEDTAWVGAPDMICAWVGKPTENNHCRKQEPPHSCYPSGLLLWAMTCFNNTPTQYSLVRLLLCCSVVSRNHLEIMLKGVENESSLENQSLIPAEHCEGQT